MKTIWYVFKSFIHFIYVFITNFLGFKHTYNLSFVKEQDKWYIDLPNWPFSHDNLEMVAGADKLCEYFDKNKQGRINLSVVTSNKKLSIPDSIECHREWAHIKWGGQYYLPISLYINGVDGIWLCQVTLFVIGWWPEYIYVKSNKTI